MYHHVSRAKKDHQAFRKGFGTEIAFSANNLKIKQVYHN